jgi:phosphate transport system permease protein
MSDDKPVTARGPSQAETLLHRAEEEAARDPFAGVDFQELELSLHRPRTLFSIILSWLVSAMTVMALVPLFAVLWMLIWRGGQKLSLALFTQLPPAPLEQGGGFGNAIVGTIIMVGIATVITVPLGVLTGVYLAQAGASKLAAGVRFSAKVLTGFPSILAGVFAYGAIVLVTGGYSAIAGGIALSILMLPTIILTAESAIAMVPAKMKEASIGLGATGTQTVWMVLLPTAMPGILTGVMLAVARAAGETAPLLFTALFSNYWLMRNGQLNLMQPTASLAVLIYNFSGMPFANQVELAWAAALVLVALVLITNLIGQSFSRQQVNQ